MIGTRVIAVAALLIGTSSLALADPPSTPETFSVTSKTEVPGLTLKPGSYSIRVVDRLSDRIIVRVDSANGGSHTTFIGLQNPDIPKPSSPGIVSWNGSGNNASYVRGWYFPSISNVVEFVYPKAEAVKIAQKTDSKVPAIDPASEGRVSDKNLSKDDMELVTLWLLSSTRVGAGGGTPAIQAEKYKETANARLQSAGSQNQVASAAPASSPSYGGSQSDSTSVSARSRSAVPTQSSSQSTTQIASLHKPKPVVAVLPHTASELPMVWLVGGFSLLGGLAMRRFRNAA